MALLVIRIQRWRFLLDFGPGIRLGSVIKAVSALNTGGRFDDTVSLVYSQDDNRCPDWRRYRFTLAALCQFYHRRRTYDDGRETRIMAFREM